MSGKEIMTWTILNMCYQKQQHFFSYNLSLYFIALKINHLLISQNGKLWDTLKEKHMTLTLTKLTTFWGKKKRLKHMNKFAVSTRQSMLRLKHEML